MKYTIEQLNEQLAAAMELSVKLKQDFMDCSSILFNGDDWDARISKMKSLNKSMCVCAKNIHRIKFMIDDLEE